MITGISSAIIKANIFEFKKCIMLPKYIDVILIKLTNITLNRIVIMKQTKDKYLYYIKYTRISAFRVSKLSLQLC